MDTSTAQSIKLFIVSATGLSKDALHIYVGLTVYLTLMAVVRRGRPYVGWLVVFGVARSAGRYRQPRVLALAGRRP